MPEDIVPATRTRPSSASRSSFVLHTVRSPLLHTGDPGVHNCQRPLAEGGLTMRTWAWAVSAVLGLA